METKPNVVKESITLPIETNTIDAINETEKPKESKSVKDKPISNKSYKIILLNKSMSLDKSRYTKRTET